MKKYYCSSRLIGKILISKPFRAHNDVVISLLNVMESFLLQRSYLFDKYSNDICICVSRRCRVFIINDQSIHCFVIPFDVISNSGDFSFNYYDEQVSFKEIQVMRSLFQNNLILTSIESFFDEFLSTMEDFSVRTQKEFDFYFSLFIHLLNFETGYIRFDHDVERSDPKVHPENHFDIFFSQKASFKIGVNKNESIEDIIDILDPETLCYFLDDIH